jgi:hypothetical protein
LQRLYLVEVSVHEVIGNNDGDQENVTLWWPCLLFPNFATLTNSFFGSMTYDKDANQTNENNNTNSNNTNSNGSMPWFMPFHNATPESTSSTTTLTSTESTTWIQAKLTLESLQQLLVSTEPTPVVYLLGPPRDNCPLSLYLSPTNKTNNSHHHHQERGIKEFWANIPDLVSSSLQYPPLEHAKRHAMHLLEHHHHQAATTSLSSSSLVDRPSTTVTTARRYPSASVSWHPPVVVTAATSSTEPSPLPASSRSGVATVISLPDEEEEEEDEARLSLSLLAATSTTTATHSDSRLSTVQPPGQETAPPPTPKHSNLKQPPPEPAMDRTNGDDDDNEDDETMFPTTDTMDDDDDDEVATHPIPTMGQQPLDLKAAPGKRGRKTAGRRKSATQSATPHELLTAPQQQEQQRETKREHGRPKRTGRTAKAVVPAVPPHDDNPVSTATSSIAVARQLKRNAAEKGKMARKGRTTKAKNPKSKTTSMTESWKSSSTTESTTSPPRDLATSTRKKSSPATDQVRETREELDLPTFSDVKPLLQKLGYTFLPGRYCLPSTNANAEPPLSFATESDFRNHLCQTHVQWEGFEFPKSQVEHVQGILLRYVRYSILSHVRRADGPTRPSFPQLNMPVRNFTKWILSLGFKYLTTTVYGGYYALPGVTRRQFQKDGPHANVFLEKPGLWNYLARQGLPQNCNFDKLTDLQRLSLEQCIAQYGMVHLAKETL